MPDDDPVYVIAYGAFLFYGILIGLGLAAILTAVGWWP